MYILKGLRHRQPFLSGLEGRQVSQAAAAREAVKFHRGGVGLFHLAGKIQE
jgi:hypothetical protein